MRIAVFFLLSLLFPMLAHADTLQVRGNKIFYGEREVRLQGVAVGDPLIAREGRPLSDYRFIADDWNANAVRISVHPGAWRDFGRVRAMEIVQRNIESALEADLFVILTWQAIGIPGDYRQVAPEDTVSDLYDTDMELAMDFWRHTAKAFGGDGRIAFELWNEPVWPEGSEQARRPSTWKELKPHWEKLAGLVRAYSSNLIIVTGSGWGYNLRGIRDSLLDDANTAYAWHIYAGTDGNDPVAWERNLDRLQEARPVLVTEWGFEPDRRDMSYFGTPEGYGYLFADRFLRDRGLHHIAWCWHPIWTPRLLEPDWETPTGFGHFTKEILWRTSKDALVRP